MPRDADQTFRVTFTDTPKYNKASVFDIEKLGVKGEPIKGVVFKVEYFDGDDDNANLTRTCISEQTKVDMLNLIINILIQLNQVTHSICMKEIS